MTELHIEQAALSKGSAMVFKDYGGYVRMAYDPNRIGEASALRLLRSYVPRLNRVPRQAVRRVTV